MKFKRHLNFEQGARQIHLVGFISVLFLLLSFLLLFSNMVQPGMRVSLPKVLAAESLKNADISIEVSNKGQVSLNGAEVTRGELKNFLNLVSGRKPEILIKADKSASMGMIEEVLDVCRESGLTRINIISSR